jgi:prepilin-type N-terminal cleavage/methylation domain-containing protein
MLRSRRDNPARGFRGAFTLIELIFVMALLAISAIFVVANVGGFFRGRILNFEARRMLSLTHYAQSRAVSEGVPIVMWFDPKSSTYGIAIQSSFTAEDAHAITYTLESSLSLVAPIVDVPPTSEQDDEKLGLPEGTIAIRFNPDGFYDPSSITRIVLRQGTDAALELGQTANQLAYEIRPASLAN